METVQADELDTMTFFQETNKYLQLDIQVEPKYLRGKRFDKASVSFLPYD